MTKIAVLQVADTGPLESLVLMLENVGYKCLLPNEELKAFLRDAGCDTVLDVEGLVQNWGYERPTPLGYASLQTMETCDLYVDIKAQRNGPLVWDIWPNLRNKTLWYRINGGEPEITEHGDEVNLNCPILTPNLWYGDDGPWKDQAYAMWPPFYRISDHSRMRSNGSYDPALCFTHNIEGWGYKDLLEPVRALGVRFFGVRSPEGLIPHQQVPEYLSKALALVHLKSSDAPGYSLYEALASKCPLIVPRRLIWRNKMQDLFIPNETCYVFDRETHEGLTEQDIYNCNLEIRNALNSLRDPEENKRIGENGHNKLKELMWDVSKDTDSLNEFMVRMFG